MRLFDTFKAFRRLISFNRQGKHRDTPYILIIEDLKSSLTVKGARDVGLEELVEYDTTVNKTKREPFVRHWAYERNDSVCKVICLGFYEIAKWLYLVIHSVAYNVY